MKKLLCMVLAAVMLFCLASCNSTSSDVTDSEDTATAPAQPSESESEDKKDGESEKTEVKDMTPITYPLYSNAWGIKVLGVRNLESDKQINCDWTCSGIEVNIDHYGGDIKFTAGASAGCYFRAFIDGEPYKKPTTYLALSGEDNGQIRLKDVPAGKHTLRLVKVTGYTLARAQLYSMTFAGEILEMPMDPSNLYIEYIGDSISCGWGTIGAHGAAYTDQDGTLAYPYLVSQELGADYSVTALSGQGLLVGNPGVPKGYLYESALRSTEKQYEFRRKADVVVVNIGTNDYSQKRDNPDDFKKAYKDLLDTIKQKNGEDCKIVCIYNTMNDTFQSIIKELCDNKQDQGIYLVEFERAVNPAAGGHPSASENKTYARVLVNLLKKTVLK